MLMETMPPTDYVLATALRDLLGDEVTVETQQDDKLLQRLPYVFLETDGGIEQDPRFALRPSFTVISWAEGSKAEGVRLAEQVRAALHDAHRSQRVYAGATLGYVRAISLPYEQRQDNQATEVFRFVAQYEAIVRPDRKEVSNGTE